MQDLDSFLAHVCAKCPQQGNSSLLGFGRLWRFFMSRKGRRIAVVFSTSSRDSVTVVVRFHSETYVGTITFFDPKAENDESDSKKKGKTVVFNIEADKTPSMKGDGATKLASFLETAGNKGPQTVMKLATA